MINNLPIYISIVFGLATLLTLALFYMAMRTSKSTSTRAKANFILFILLAWIQGQILLAFNDYYSNNSRGFPPKFLLAVVPMLLTIAILFITKKGRIFIYSLSLKSITWVNVVRIPVEFVLYWLSLHKAVPVLMTFAGRNFDIIVGITAPFVAYYGFNLKRSYRKLILLWNFIGLGLLINIVVNAVLSAPFSFQQFAFDQPNTAILYFPFILLPAFIVPVILFGHLVSIRQLIKRKR